MNRKFDENLVALLPNLRRYAFSLSQRWDVADDLVQQTCQKAITNHSSYEEGTRMDAWLFKIMRNSFIDLTRRQKTEGNKIDIDEAHSVSGCDGNVVTENRLMLDRVFAEIQKLPDDQREVLLLVCVEELSYKEASNILETPIGTIMSRLARARKKLSQQLGINHASDRSQSE